MSNSVQPHRQQPTRLLRPWDSPGKNAGMGCHFLFQCMKVESESEVVQSCRTLPGPMDYSLPGSSVQARVLEWVAFAFSNFIDEVATILWPRSVGFPGRARGREPANVGDGRDVGSIPGLGRSPGVRNGNPLRYSCLENSMDRGSWLAAVHGVQESLRHNWAHTHTHTHTHTCTHTHTHTGQYYSDASEEGTQGVNLRKCLLSGSLPHQSPCRCDLSTSA